MNCEMLQFWKKVRIINKSFGMCYYFTHFMLLIFIYPLKSFLFSWGKKERGDMKWVNCSTAMQRSKIPSWRKFPRKYTEDRAYSRSLLHAIIACYHLPVLKIFSNFGHFWPIFQIFCPFLHIFWKIACMPLLSRIGPGRRINNDQHYWIQYASVSSCVLVSTSMQYLLSNLLIVDMMVNINQHLEFLVSVNFGKLSKLIFVYAWIQKAISILSHLW